MYTCRSLGTPSILLSPRTFLSSAEKEHLELAVPSGQGARVSPSLYLKIRDDHRFCEWTTFLRSNKKICEQWCCYTLHVQTVTKSGLTGTVPMSTAIWVLCFKFQIQNGTLGTKLDTRSILCFIHAFAITRPKWYVHSVFHSVFHSWKVIILAHFFDVFMVANWNQWRMNKG